MRLLNDIARCQDKDCPRANICARYKQRNTGEEGRTPTAATFREDVDVCARFIFQPGVEVQRTDQ